MKKRNRQEYSFSLRVKKMLEAAGFTVLMMPQGRYRRQIIDMLVIKSGCILPMEAKGKQSKYLKEHNARQLEMQKEIFWKSGTPFCRVIQGNKPGQITIEVYAPPEKPHQFRPHFYRFSRSLIPPVKSALKIKEAEA